MMYYLLRGSERIGPFSEEQVRGMLAQGQARPEMLAWRDGLSDWVPLGSLLVGPAAPVIPMVPAAPLSTGWSIGRILKGCLTAFGAFAAVAIVLGAIGYGIFDYYGTGFDRSSKAYVDDAVPQIVNGWSSDELIQRVSPSYAALFKKPDVDALFQKFTRLGEFQRYKGSTGESRMNFGPGGVTVSAKYDCHVTFKNGEATVTVGLVREAGQWKIIGFHIDTPSLF